MELKLSESSLPATILGTSYKNFSLLSQTRKLHISRISLKGQDIISKNILVHVVKQGEIVASHKDITDSDVVFEGQYLHISSTVAGIDQVCHFNRDKSQEHRSSKAAPSFGFNGGQWGQIINVALQHKLLHVNAKSSLLVLVPLIAFCIRCIIGALQNRVARSSRCQSENHFGRSNSERWRTVLGEMKDTDQLDAEYQHPSEGLSRDRERMHSEYLSRDYAKLENDYQKFLADCGMSKWGYFRGGQPE